MNDIARTTWGRFLLAGLALVLISGCNTITVEQVRFDLSPELDGVAHTGQQLKNRRARTYDTQLRQIHDDAAAVLMEDHPSLLTQWPIP